MQNVLSFASNFIGMGMALTFATPDFVGFAADVLNVSRDQISALAISGAFGAFARAIGAPEPSWRKRASQGMIGALSAVFLGGIVAHVLDAATGAGPYAYLCAGFLMGEGGLLTIHLIRDKIIKNGNHGGGGKKE